MDKDGIPRTDPTAFVIWISGDALTNDAVEDVRADFGELADVIELAHEGGCSILVLDVDAEPMPGLPSFMAEYENE